MNKKRILAFGFLVFFVILASQLVSAYSFPFDFRTGGEQLIEWLSDIFSPFFKFLLGAESYEGHFFVSVLLLILLYVVVLSITKRMRIFSRYPFAYILISAIVSVLGARYMSENDLITGVLIPYGTLGVSVAVFLPLLIYFFFVHDSVPGSTGRRVAWILFAAVFFGLWITRLDEMGAFNWIYLIGLIIVGISFFFDKRVHMYFELGKHRQSDMDAQVMRLSSVKNDIQAIERAHGPNPDKYPGRVYETYLRLQEAKKKLEKKVS